MFTNTPPPLHAQQAAARLNEGARTFIIYFTLSCALRVFPYASLSTRLSLRVSLYASLYTSLSMRLPFYIREARARHGQQRHEQRYEQRHEQKRK